MKKKSMPLLVFLPLFFAFTGCPESPMSSKELLGMKIFPEEVGEKWKLGTESKKSLG